MSYWCIFEDSSKNGTVNLTDPPAYQGDWPKYHAAVREAVNATAKALTGLVPIEVHALPYPAHPQLNPSGWPSFCFGKEQCWGRSSCPRPYSCVD